MTQRPPAGPAESSAGKPARANGIPAALLLALAVTVGLGSSTALAPLVGEMESVAAARARTTTLPLAFEETPGPEGASFLARGPGCGLLLTDSGMRLALRDRRGPDLELRLSLVGASVGVRGRAGVPLPGVVNYLVGRDPAQWRVGVPTFGSVRYEEVYHAIDLEFHGRGGRLEYDFIVRPGGDPGAILLRFEGAERAEIDAAGRLLLQCGERAVVWDRPVSYQDHTGERRSVASEYTLVSDREVAIRVGAYDRAQPLVIDPVLVYATLVGGSDFDAAESIAVGPNGNAYITGSTVSPDFPTLQALRNTPAGGADVFVTKLTSNGTAISYSTYLGGSGDEAGLGIAVATNNNAYITGFTDSTNFPVRNAFQTNLSGTGRRTEAFLVRLAASGSNLSYSTYFGGTQPETGFGVALHTNGHAVIAGETASSGSFPSKTPFQAAVGGRTDAFVARFDTLKSGTNSLVFASRLGGPESERARGVAVGTNGTITLVGDVESTNLVSAGFPVTNALQPTFGGGVRDAFVARIGAAGTNKVWATYLGGSGDDVASRVAVDRTNAVYICGETTSTNFPLVHPMQSIIGGGITAFTSDAFVSKIRSAGSVLLYSTYLGGAINDVALDVALDASGLIAVAGYTGSRDFPTTRGCVQPEYGGGSEDGFVAMLDSTAAGPSSLVFSTFFGGSDMDEIRGVALDPQGNCFVAGQTSAGPDFPVTPGAFQTEFGGGFGDAFVAKFNTQPVLDVSRAGNTLTLSWPALPGGFRLDGAAAVINPSWSVVPNAVTTTGGRSRVLVNLPSAFRYFRLNKP